MEQQASKSDETDNQKRVGLIFEDEALLSAVDAIGPAKGDTQSQRKEFAALIGARWAACRKQIEDTFLASPKSAAPIVQAYADLTDQLVTSTFNFVVSKLYRQSKATKSERLAVLAVGGYGRQEMAPFSDIDLLFLTPHKLSPWAENVIETMLYVLWDLKLKIGHSTRSISECVQLGKSDQTIKTALLESRYIVGDQDIAADLERDLWSKLFKGSDAAYIEEKLEERDKRHARQGGQRYMLEPNVKEGKGGLRDLQTLFWITKHVIQEKSTLHMVELGYFTKSEYRKFTKAHDFLWAIRCHMHLISKRAVEQLTFDVQVAVAERMHYKDKDGRRGVEFFMQDYFRHATLVGELTRIFLTALEAQHVKNQPTLRSRLFAAIGWNAAQNNDDIPNDYQITHGRLGIKNRKIFDQDPVNILRVFELGLKTGYLIHPDAMRLVTSKLNLIDDTVRQDPEARRIFMSLLLDYGNPERALRRMNELGVLGAFIPEFQRIIAMMQFNFYHHYTVDEHTIQVISELAKIEQAKLKEELPILTNLLKSGIDRRVLYVALLLHDIGKGLPEDHSIAGARFSEEICPRLGLNELETETVVWLVENHLLMSDVAQKRDLSDPRTVLKFARTVKSRSRLNLLTILTVCDIRGVGPGTWDLWKAQLIRQLYLASAAAIDAGLDKEGVFHTADGAKDDLAKELADWSQDDLNTELSRHYDPYWQGLDTQSHVKFAHMLRRVTDDKFVTDIEPDAARNATRACFAMEDHPGLFARLAGALAMVGANVMDARSFTSSDGYATSIFWIQDMNGKPYAQSAIGRLEKMIQQTLGGQIKANKAIRSKDKFKKRERDFQVSTAITFDNEGSELYTIIEVDTRDRPALLYDLARCLRNNNVYIASAVIATYGAQAVDVFYVKDMFGMKIHSPRKREALAAKLKEAIAHGVEEAMS